jgi:GNAT superfamily N-acetyltransferase
VCQDGEQPEVVFQAEDYGEAHAERLAAMVCAATREMPGHPDLKPPVGQELDPPERGSFVVAYVNGQPGASGGYRTFAGDPSGDTVEFVRMYVRPDARRTGLGRALLVELEERALDDDYRWAVLDVDADQRSARALYEFLGYRPVPGGSAGRVLYGKELTD